MVDIVMGKVKNNGSLETIATPHSHVMQVRERGERGRERGREREREREEKQLVT